MAEKKLKPSMREKKRYLLLDRARNKEEIEKTILDFIGILGYAKSGLYFVNDKIIAVNREMVNEVKASFALSENKINVKRISGSLKKLKDS
jgi:RNase P/RNase MRP subunit POP5